MTITLEALIQDVRKLEIDINGETLNVTYRPSSYTLATEREFKNALHSDMPANALAVVLVDMIEEWDLLDDSGNVIPPETKNLQTIPSWFIVRVSNALMDDMNASREDRKNSGAGSRRQGSLASSRRGGRNTN